MIEKWYWSKASPKHTLKKLFRAETKFCFLAGSGISVDPPSCLPTGYQLAKALIERFIPQEEQQAILTLTDSDRKEMYNAEIIDSLQQCQDFYNSRILYFPVSRINYNSVKISIIPI